MVEINSRKAALIGELEVSRGEIRSAVRDCETNLNPANLVRRSVQENKVLWIVGAAVAGLALSQLLRLRMRRPPAPRVSGAPVSGGRPSEGPKIVSWAARLAFDFARPVLTEWALKTLSRLDFSAAGDSAKKGGDGVDGRRP